MLQLLITAGLYDLVAVLGLVLIRWLNLNRNTPAIIGALAWQLAYTVTRIPHELGVTNIAYPMIPESLGRYQMSSASNGERE